MIRGRPCVPTRRYRTRALIAVLLGLSVSSPVAGRSDALFAAMEAATVRVLCVPASTSETGLVTGSGFVIGSGRDSRFVVTNWHVVDCTARGGAAGVLIGPAADGFIATRILGQDRARDLALLEAARPLGRPSARLATLATLRKGDSVWAYGFPGSADRMGADPTEASLHRGIVGRLLGQAADASAARLIQHSAGINPGSSGGPLYDDFGRVVGVNTQKSLAAVLMVGPDGEPQIGRVPEGEGIGWAVATDDLLELLERLGIAHQASRTRPGALARRWRNEPLLVITLGLLLSVSVIALGLATTHRGRALVREQVTQGRLLRSRERLAPNPVPTPNLAPIPRSVGRPDPLPAGVPCLRGVAGPYAGTLVPLAAGPVTIGRDPAMAQLVLPASAKRVSKRHARVSWDPVRRRFAIEDCWSRHGTLIDGTPVPPGRAVTLAPGQCFQLADADIVFEVDFS